MSDIWFVSDNHFQHQNIIKFANRPFSDVIEMNSVMIDNHNKLIKQNDIVYCLGDFSFCNPMQFLKCLNGKWHLIRGNHDHKRAINYFESVKDVYGLTVGKNYFWLSHFPHYSWNKSFHGSFHLFGHVHSKFSGIGKSMDVGVDTNNFYPYHIDEVIEILSKKENIQKC